MLDRLTIQDRNEARKGIELVAKSINGDRDAMRAFAEFLRANGSGVVAPSPSADAAEIPEIIDELYRVVIDQERDERVELANEHITLIIETRDCDCPLVHTDVLAIDHEHRECGPLPTVSFTTDEDGSARYIEFMKPCLAIPVDGDGLFGAFAHFVLRRFNLGRAVPDIAFMFEVEGQEVNFAAGAVLHFDGDPRGRGKVTRIDVPQVMAIVGGGEGSGDE